MDCPAQMTKNIQYRIANPNDTKVHDETYMIVHNEDEILRQRPSLTRIECPRRRFGHLLTKFAIFVFQKKRIGQRTKILENFGDAP